MSPDGSGQRRLAPAHYGMRWSPDGQKIAFSGAGQAFDGIYVMNGDGSGQQRPTSGGMDRRSRPGRRTGGNRICAGTVPDGRVSDIFVINADGSEERS